MSKKVDVGICKTYYWDCPKCGEFNKKSGDLRRNPKILICAGCGLVIRIRQQSRNRDFWIAEEV